MGPSPGKCEIVELREELNSAQPLKEPKPLSCGRTVDNRDDKFLMQKLANKYTLEDDINKLFEEIELRASARGMRSSSNLSKDSIRKSALKKSIRGGVSQASGIGISESATLKQALRGLCISHASEMAAMKRLSKSMVGLSKVSEAGAIKRLYRAVVMEANDSGLPLDGGKGSLVEISLVPEKGQINSSKKTPLQAPREKSLRSSTHRSSEVAVTAKTTESSKAPQNEICCVSTEIGRNACGMNAEQEGKPNSSLSLSRPNSCSRTAQQNNDVSAFIETGKKKAMIKFGKNLKLNFASSLIRSTVNNKVNKSISNSPSVVKPVRKNKCFPNKKVRNEQVSACTSSNTCSADEKSDMSPCTSNLFLETQDGNQSATEESPQALSSSCLNVKVSFSTTDSRANKPGFSSDGCRKRNFDANASECSRSRGPVDFSQSSISSIGEYSNSTCISEDSHSLRSTCTGSKPHMSNDSRWGAIRHVEMRHGKLALRHFKLLKRLGCGDLGTVYLAELTGTDCLFAVKVMDTDSLAGKKKTPRAQTEREIMQMLDHPFLPTLYAHFTTNKFSILIMEYCPGGDLHILRQKQPGRTFSEIEARFYVAEVLLALEYLHMLGIVYRDLKPENILVREDGHIMLCDFDLSLRCTVQPTLVKTSSPIIAPTENISRPCMESSCIVPYCLHSSCVLPCFAHRSISSSTKAQSLKSSTVVRVPQLLAEPTSARSNSFVGTHEYLAPEIIRGEGHGNAVDWWTFGIFLYEILFGTTPFKGLGNDETLANIVMHRIKFPRTVSISSQAKDLIKGLLIKEPQYRFGSVKGAAEIRQHPFFEGLNWALIRCTIPPVLPESNDAEVRLLASEESKLVEYKKTADEHPEFELF